MRGIKAGLADLKQLHEKDQATRKQAQARAEAARAAEIASGLQHAEPLTEEARKLFARATQTVMPIQAKNRVLHRRTDSDAPRANTAATIHAATAQRLAQKRIQATGLADEPKISAAGKLQSGISDFYAPIKDTDHEIAWASPGIGPDTLRKLKQAFWPVGAHLDLHGMNSDQARTALLDFIDSSQQHGTRCIRIVHGQGYGSINGHAVLKKLVSQWLTQIAAISCFASAPQAHGGRGALLALIRQA